MSVLETVFRSVCDASWRAGVLILLLLGLRIIWRGRVPARAFLWAWVAVAVTLIIPRGVVVAWSPYNWLGLPTTIDRTAGAPGAYTTVDVARGRATDRSVQYAPADRISAGPRGDMRPEIKIKSLAAIWAFGVGVLLILRLTMVARFAGRIRRSLRPADADLAAAVQAIFVELGQRPMPFGITSLVTSPSVCGVLRPVLLFPPGFSHGLTSAQLRLIVLHEVGHCRNRDLAALAIVHLACALHWFNPLVWVARACARLDCEIACDEFVLRHMGTRGTREDYGQAILQLAAAAPAQNQLSTTLSFIESKHKLIRRIHMIAAYKPTPFTFKLIGGAVLGFVVAMSITRETQAQLPASPAITTEAPTGWWKNGKNHEAYVGGVDRSDTWGGMPSAYIKSVSATTTGDFGGMMQMTSAQAFIGKRLRFTGWMKTDNANDGGAHLWFRVDGTERGQSLQFDNMGDRPVTGTTTWQQYSVVLDVPNTATALAFGFFVQGAGQAWVSSLRLEEVGPDVPSTNIRSRSPAIQSRSLPAFPVNLGFQ